VTVRFSDFAGVPTVPDNDPNAASPRGIAIRFHLGEHVHTDIVGHSHDGFPTRTGEEFLEFARALAASGPNTPKPTPLDSFLSTHPKALEFAIAPKPIPTSFARESFYGVNAFRFTNKDGVSRFGRYRILPEAGREYLDTAAAAAKSKDFLFDEIVSRLERAPVHFRILVQLAESGDTVNDATINWPEERPLLEFGTIALTRPAPDDSEHRRIIFDPVPRVDGITPSDDPLIELRAAVYILTDRRRRAAGQAAAG
jgi:catalase